MTNKKHDINKQITKNKQQHTTKKQINTINIDLFVYEGNTYDNDTLNKMTATKKQI